MIRYTLGWLMMFMGVFFTVPLITAAVYWESAFFAFLIMIALSVGLGVLMTLKKPKSSALYAKEGFVIVSASWILLSLFGALSFILSGVTTSFVDALF